MSGRVQIIMFRPALGEQVRRLSDAIEGDEITSVPDSPKISPRVKRAASDEVRASAPSAAPERKASHRTAGIFGVDQVVVSLHLSLFIFVTLKPRIE